MIDIGHDGKSEVRRSLEQISGFGPNLCQAPNETHHHIVGALVEKIERLQNEISMLRWTSCRYLEEVDAEEQKHNATKAAEVPKEPR